MGNIGELIAHVLAEHARRGIAKVYANTIASEESVAQWEGAHRLKLPYDYRLFLQKVGACKLHGPYDMDYEFAVKLFGLGQVEAFPLLAYGNNMVVCPSEWFAIADAQEGNYIIMDLASAVGSSVNILDGFSMSGPDFAIIARSFTEFLEHSVRDPETSSGSGDAKTGRRYWSSPGGYYGQVR